MDTGYRGSAKIYQFPIRPRAARGEHRPAATTGRSWLRVGEVVVDDNWYHEAAIQAEKEANAREH